MKKKLAIVTVVLLMSGVPVAGFAAKTTHAKKPQAATETVTGTVVSVDVANKQIVVTDGKTGQNRVFIVSAQAASVVKAGEKVDVKCKVGSSTASSVKALNQQSKKK